MRFNFGPDLGQGSNVVADRPQGSNFGIDRSQGSNFCPDLDKVPTLSRICDNVLSRRSAGMFS